MSKANISDQILNILTQIGVNRIYGIPGDTIDSLMESIREQSKVKLIVLRHEETGAFACAAQAKLTNQIAVCVACQGPGANHLINGLYDAKADRVPVLAITGSVPSDLIGTRMPQETNQIKLFDDCTVFNAEARSAKNVPIILEQAINTALSKRGPAHVSIPSDIMRMPAVEWQLSQLPKAEIFMPDQQQIDAAAMVLNKANKVAILYGEGSRDASKELIQIAEKLQAPLIHTTRSKDIVANDHVNCIGGMGLMGSVAANHAMKECDALLIVGSNYAWREFYPKQVPTVQIDREASHIGIRTNVTHPLLGDSQLTLTSLIKKIEQKDQANFLTACKKKNAGILSHLAFDPKKSKDGDPIHPQAFMQKLSEHVNDDTIFAVDAGTITIWANNILKIKKDQRFIWNANLASLGNGLPYAIASQLEYPNRQVIALCGDGGFQMSIMDLPTVVMYQLPIIIVVYNNSAYRFIELEEQGEGNPTFGTKFVNPDYAKLAEAHGMQGLVVKNYSDIDNAIKTALSAKQPFLLDVLINPEELIIPPVINKDQALHFAESQIRSWFAKKHEIKI